MNKKEFFEWLETCPTHKWEVNDEELVTLARVTSPCFFQRKKKTRRRKWGKIFAKPVRTALVAN
jgi:hypothetical protein